MEVRFWGTRGSVPSPGHETTRYGGNTSCVEVLTRDGTQIILDCGTGARALGQHLLQSRKGPHRLHLFIGHIHWDHIQGFPFFAPAFLPDTELHVYAPYGFRGSIEESLAGQMQHAYFPLKLNELQSRIEFTPLGEGFFRLGKVLIETQHLNHTAPTIAYRISADGATLVYSTDHEPFWQPGGLDFRHPGDQRHIAFLEGADLVIHDAQYLETEYAAKIGWGHSTIEYATDVAAAARARRLALFHHDPVRSDRQVQALEERARKRAEAQGSLLDVFAAAEGHALQLEGAGAAPHAPRLAATVRRPIAGCSVLVVGANERDWLAIEPQLVEDHLLVMPAANLTQALGQIDRMLPDLVVIASSEQPVAQTISVLRRATNRPNLPALIIAGAIDEEGDLASADLVNTDHIPRPFSPPMLRNRVRVWLSRFPEVEPGVPDGSAPGSGQRAEPSTKRGGSREEISRVLGAVPLFSPLSPDELDLLCARATERSFSPGETIIHQGGRSDELFVILSGRAHVLGASEGLSETARVLGELGPNEIVGEMAALTGMPRSATVVAGDALRCLEISGAAFLRLVKTTPQLAASLAQALARRIYATDRRMERFAPDPLTGLLGREAFEEQYARLAALARRRGMIVTLILLDVTNLKGINDALGYETGNDVLRALARALVETPRQTDFVARYGGDEFALLLVDPEPEGVDLVIQRLARNVGAQASAQAIPCPIRCTYGVTTDATPAAAVAELVARADRDMQSKAHSLELYFPSGAAPRGAGQGADDTESSRTNRRRRTA